MTREEKALSFEIRAREEIDPYFRERLQFHLVAARGRLKEALGDITVAPEAIDELDYKIRTYGRLLSVALKMDVVPKTKDDAFAEANVTAQQEEAGKLTTDASS
jgi:hypothetical protein